MRPPFTCQAVISNNGIQRVHLVADDGHQRGDVFLNIPADWFQDGETPREHRAYYVQITEAAAVAGLSKEQRS
jgi:hypothetical protein